ncbi:MAG TPA: hypothetical protein VE172_23440 [Stackebrandtia sp.]|jgi:hypothetical protein|uniref:LppU/SCO3897 family protein n=1 Tax=Stackebrandtia sp. TaxID=2023065 RepID=UPI002D5438A8|nr:hypothetical protein [Stackebrandtia sp.]HZE41764.1 hypothetical protein [Stackebrandtia sp.]
MTQPPPYQGGYPQQPDPYANNGYGQPAPPPPGPAGGTPSGFPSNPQPGGGQPYGQQPSGFPSNPQAGGPVPPPPSGGKKVGKTIGGIIAVIVVLVLVFAGKVLLRVVLDDGVAEATGDTEVADKGDCTTKFSSKVSTDASDVTVVKCSAKDAYFKVVGRDDDPTETDAEKAASKACDGTAAATYMYQENSHGGGLDWLLCLDPLDIKTAKYGEMPGQVGDCWASDTSEYFQIVDCSDPSAKYKITDAKEKPQTSTNDPTDASAEVCSDNAKSYFSEPQDSGPFDWFICTTDVS